MNESGSTRLVAPWGDDGYPVRKPGGHRVLVGEDNPVSAAALAGDLERWGYVPQIVRDGAEVLEALAQDDAPRLVLLDWEMPRVDGIEVCRRLRRRAADRYTYVILLTGRARPEHVREGLETGADDYVVKPWNSSELEMRVKAGWRILDLEEHLVLAREALHYQAYLDPLTALPNRRCVVEVLEREVARVAGTERAMAAIVVDVDHFKHVNDAHGHAAGDCVLIELAGRLADSVRSGDVVGRYGGEEFVIVLPGTSPADALGVAERVRKRLRAEPIPCRTGVLPVTASFGVAASTDARRRTAVEMLREADQALYRAKATGRDRVVGSGDAG